MPSESRDALIAVAERWIHEIWQERNIEAVNQIHASHFIDRSPSGRGADNAAYIEGLRELFDAFPDFYTSIEDLIVDETNNKVAIRWTATGTHAQSFLGCQPTHRRIEFAGIEIITILNEEITERWGEWDGLSLLEQLQEMPA